MGILLLLGLGAGLWAWRTGRLARFVFGDFAAAAAALVALRLLATGRLWPGLVVLALAGMWAAKRLRPVPGAMPLVEARALLDLPDHADLAAVRAAHRRLIARVHPDAGGSGELARRVNAARDALIAELKRPR